MLEDDRIDVSERIDVTKSMICASVLFVNTATFLN